MRDLGERRAGAAPRGGRIMAATICLTALLILGAVWLWPSMRWWQGMLTGAASVAVARVAVWAVYA